MNLNNFGSILNFAKEIETIDEAFYAAACKNPSCKEYKDIFEEFAKNLKKNIKIAERTLRENISEMILESISNFTKDPFYVEIKDIDSMDEKNLIEFAKKLEKRAMQYYAEASQKLKALSEVSRALKMLGKKRGAHLNKLENIK
jgi:hypothetical protein